MARACSRLVSVLCSTTAAGMLAACGGGGGADAAPESTAAPTSLSGSVVKGPVSGATVTAYAVSGGTMGAQLGTAVTDPQGAFTMPMGASAGAVMLQMAGGSYVDEATGATVTMGPGQVMTAVLSSLASGTASVQVTPLTAMAQAMAARLPGGLTPANIDAANAAVGSYFLVSDIVHTRPMNPLVSGAAVGATAAMMNYGIALAAMSQYAKEAGVSSPVLVGAMMQDAADGVLDGKAGTTPIALGSGMMGAGMMQSTVGGTGLASAMANFMNGAANRSGLTPASMTPLMQQLTTATGRMR